MTHDHSCLYQQLELFPCSQACPVGAETWQMTKTYQNYMQPFQPLEACWKAVQEAQNVAKYI